MKQIITEIKGLFIGLLTVFIHLFRKSVTLEYPEKKAELNCYFRGKHILNNCIGCKICQKVCPCNAITIDKIENIVYQYIIDLSKCMFCGNCMYYCPQKCISMSGGYELATNNKKSLMSIIENKRR